MIRIISYRVFLLVFCLLQISLLWAHDLPDTIRIREITVTEILKADRSPLHHSRMDSLSKATSRNITLAELLVRHSDVYVRRSGRGLLATASVRGTDASHTCLYWNGMKMNSAMNGQVDLSLVPVFFLDDISIYYGGSSLVSGSGALGGSMEMSSRPDWSASFSGKLMQEFASFGTSNTFFKTGITRDKWHFDTRLLHTWSRNDYSYLNRTILPARRERVRNAGYQHHALLQEGYFRFNADNLLSLRLWWQQSVRNLPPVASYEGNQREEMQEDDALRMILGWSHYYDKGDIQLSTGWASTRLDYHLRSVHHDYVYFDARNLEFACFAGLEHEHRFGEKLRMLARMRLDLQDVSNHESVRQTGYRGLGKALSVMGSLYRQFGGSCNAYLLIREDITDNRGMSFMPSTGLEYRIPVNADLRFKANISRNRKIPDLNDLYWVPGGNPELKPEQGLSSDIGLTCRLNAPGSKLQVRLGTYYADIEDWIIWIPTPYGYWMASNIKRVVTRGLECQLVFSIKRDLWDCRFSANHTLTLATDESKAPVNDLSRGRQLIYTPRHAGNLNLHVSRNRFFCSLHSEYSGRRFTQSSNDASGSEIVLNPYMLNDLVAGRNVKLFGQRFLVQAGIRNVFDTEYQMILSRPMPGRNYSLILEYRF